MPKRTDLRSILILGSGPIRIGQACEFDYSGAQACRVLRREGYRVVLVNSNPATIMTDPEWADATYLEPLDAETVAEVIEREQPDAILPTLGGQTALNLAVELRRSARRRADRRRPRARSSAPRTASSSARPCTASASRRRAAIVAHSPDVEFPVPAIVRPAFTLGGTGGGIALHARGAARARSRTGSTASPVGQVLVEEYLAGWQEHELEVMCDARGNAVVVCSIENLDPMGVHTGDSWTIAPQQTLPDPVYQQLREAAFATARAVGVATGGANVQFAVQPESGEFRVIEMNPRVSRSSALASKATGFPIAKLAALLAVGFTLDELPNDITGKTTAAFEPALDYVAVKAPRFDFEKFPRAERRLGAEMRAVGEALGLGRTFAEAFVKAMEGREAPPVAFPADDAELVARAAEPVPERWDLLLEAARRGLELPGIHPYFADRLREVAARDASDARQAGAARGRLVRRRVRGADAVLLRHARGRRRGPGAVGPRGDRARRRARTGSGRRSSSTTAASTPRRRCGSSATRRCSSTRTPRRSRPTTTPPTGSTSSRSSRAERARRLRARAAGRRRRLVRRADAAPARARARRGRRAAARRPARRDRRRRGSRPLRRARGRPGAGVGGGRERRGGARGRRSGSATRCSSGRTT